VKSREKVGAIFDCAWIDKSYNISCSTWRRYDVWLFDEVSELLLS
jgi:hypothetical protein